jgi:cytochrome c oxidase assembly protein Cox11
MKVPNLLVIEATQDKAVGVKISPGLWKTIKNKAQSLAATEYFPKLRCFCTVANMIAS